MKEYTMQQLSELTDLPVRTIRFYIQKGLVDRPIGERKGAKYNEDHVAQCLKIKKWTAAGLSLDKVAQALVEPPLELPTPPKKTGDVSMKTCIHLAEGVELIIDSDIAQLSASDIRSLANTIISQLGNK
ncbi:helix-turn-helix domain-containing protein [Vibrio rarus]|uniref:helix-turn-helix domain-containing protein n=1 Tax=Vibrio rarus TaxID=413403 RepID=UPI0021C4402C|nr:helix-turn-helix domain-containing protein [Vibrio rarus]